AIFLLSVSVSSGHSAEQKIRSIDELMAVIKGPDKKVAPWDRWEAIFEIGKHGTVEAAEKLLSLFDSELEVWAVMALGHIKDQKAVPLMLPKLSHKDEWVRFLVCNAVGMVGGDDAVSALIGVAKNDDQMFVRQKAVHALGHELVVNPKGPVIPALLEIAKIDELAEDARYTLRFLRDEGAVHRLYPALASEDTELRKLACDMIRQHGHSASTDRLLELLKKEDDEEVIGSAIVALASVHRPERAAEVTAVFAGYLRDERNASAALQGINAALRVNKGIGPKNVASLGKALLPTLVSKQSSMRHSGANAFQKLSFPAAAPKLITLLKKEEDRYIRDAAVIALGNCLRKEKELRFLLNYGKEKSVNCDTIEDALERLHKSIPVSPLIDQIQKQESPYAREAIKALGCIKDPSTAKPLLDLVEKGGPLASPAAETLVLVAGKDELPRMADLLINKSGHRNPGLIHSFVALDRLNAFAHTKAMLSAGGEKENKALVAVFYRWNVVPADDRILIQALATESKEVRRAAIDPLSRLDSREGRKAMCAVLQNDPDRSVREDAGKALGNFADVETIECLISAYDKALVDKNAILVKESIQSGLQAATGQRYEDAKQYRAWLSKRLGVDKGIDKHIQLLAHEDEKVRLLAAREIAQWPVAREQRKALAPLIALIKKGGRYAEELEWIRALGRIGDPSVVSLLRIKLEDGSDLKGIAIIAKALADLNNTQGVDLMINMLSPDWDGRTYDQNELIDALSVVTGQPLQYDADVWLQWWANRKNAL
ncbi:MAG: HEAT repeat domain-containing protein, partial [Desulfobacteraceae bacterium]